jgi:hypothetical protein
VLSAFQSGDRAWLPVLEHAGCQVCRRFGERQEPAIGKVGHLLAEGTAGGQFIHGIEIPRRRSARPFRRPGRTIEQETAKLPSDTFLWLAIGSMIVSATMELAGKKHGSVFVGQWAPAFLLFGVYNKLVKQLGSDRVSA